ncbi:MAG TPA: hypothetical protein VIK86_00050, partial [Candidatus Paceibacterota bacterium]
MINSVLINFLKGGLFMENECKKCGFKLELDSQNDYCDKCLSVLNKKFNVYHLLWLGISILIILFSAFFSLSSNSGFFLFCIVV